MDTVLVRLVATVRVDRHAWELTDKTAVNTAVGEFLTGVAMPNAECPCDPEWKVIVDEHIHYSDEGFNCDTCVEHGMDEMN